MAVVLQGHSRVLFTPFTKVENFPTALVDVQESIFNPLHHANNMREVKLVDHDLPSPLSTSRRNPRRLPSIGKC
jgi:hypothetical protein